MSQVLVIVLMVLYFIWHLKDEIDEKKPRYIYPEKFRYERKKY